MYTLNTSTSHISARLHNIDYMIAFRSVMLARKVHYQLAKINSTNNISMLPGVDKITHHIPRNNDNTKLHIDTVATLFVPKQRKIHHDPIMDDGVFMEMMSEQDVFVKPLNGINGLLLPVKVLDETDEEMVLRCISVDPIMTDDDKTIRSSLKSLFD